MAEIVCLIMEDLCRNLLSLLLFASFLVDVPSVGTFYGAIQPYCHLTSHAFVTLDCLN